MDTKQERAIARKQWKRLAWKLPWLLLIPIGLLLPTLCARYPDFIETHYSRGLYPKISLFLGALSAHLPGSIAELLLYLLTAFLCALVILFAVRLLQRRERLVRAVRFLLSLGIAAGLLLNLFYWVWGFNYMRVDIADTMGLDVKERSTEELEALCLYLRDEATALRPAQHEDENGVYALREAPAEAFAKIPEAYAKLGLRYPELFSNPCYAPKSVFASEALSYAGISGIYFPFTAEANVNMHQPPLLLLSSAAHEAAHYMGIAKEDEANFIAYLACMESEDAAIRYSGLMLALIHAGNALYDADKEAYILLRASYSEAMERDLAHYNAYWESYEGEVEETMDKINDTYLKHNKQRDGVQSYGRMVDLLLAYAVQP